MEAEKNESFSLILNFLMFVLLSNVHLRDYYPAQRPRAMMSFANDEAFLR